MAPAIVVQNVGKRFRRYHADKPLTIHETLLRGFRKLAPAEYFWGLKDINFQIAPGRMVGVLGRNGAGKSTLLRLLGGIVRPDQGSINVHKRVRALLSLGAGFHPELTGRENLFVNGVINGYTRREVQQDFDSIVSFAELQDYIDQPLRTYSSGMQMRLAFSIAIHSAPDILLIDEVLAVGDHAFRRRCMERIAQLKSSGCTIIVVTHDTAMVQGVCDECLLLRAGQLEAHGPTHVVVQKFLSDTETGVGGHLMVTKGKGSRTLLEQEAPRPKEPIATQPVQITSIRLLNTGGVPLREMDCGGHLVVEINFLARQRVSLLNFAVGVRRDDGISCCEVSTLNSEAGLSGVVGQGKVVLHLEELDLNGGLYSISASAIADERTCLNIQENDTAWVTVRPNGNGKGIMRVAHRWEAKGLIADVPATSLSNKAS